MWISVVASGIFFSKVFTFGFSVVNFVFLITSLATTWLNFFKSTITVYNLPTSISSTFVLKLFKLVRTLTKLLMSNLPNSAFKVIKSILGAKSDVSTSRAWYLSFLV